MKTYSRNLTISCLVVCTVMFCCTTLDPDHTQPEVTLVFPPDNAVIGSAVRIQAEAMDDQAISRVEFFVDDRRDSTADDFASPFEYLWEAAAYDSIEIGGKYRLFVKAFDEAENEMISNFVNVFYEWTLVTSDKDEQFLGDISQIYGRSSQSMLEFRVQTYGEWGNAQDSSGINLALFLDVDQNSQTGLPPSDSAGSPGRSIVDFGASAYSVNDIGADFVLVLGIDGNGLYAWDGSSASWQFQSPLSFVSLASDTNVVEFGISLGEVSRPANIDVVAANLVFEPDTVFWDWVPDTLHTSYAVDGAYLEGSN